MFSYRPVSEEDFALHGEKMQYIPIETATSKLDLSLEAAKTAGHFEFFLEYATALFDEASMQLFSRSYCAALAELVGGEAGSLAEVTALAAADRIALYEKPCRMRMPYLNQPLDVTISQMAELLGEQPAVIFGEETISYAALERRACEIAGQLFAAGVLPGETVAFAHRRTPDLFAVMLGILKAGCAYLPLLSSFPETRLQYMLENAGVRVLLCDEKSRKELPENLPCKILLKDTLSGPYQPLTERGEDEIISVLYTSGSTGQPKGVPNYHRSMANLLANLEGYLEGAGQTVLCTTGVVFDTFLTESLLPLCMGKRIVLADEEQMMMPWQIAALCRQHGADIMQYTPSRLQMCLGNDAFASAVAGVKLVLLAGEALSPVLLENLRSKTNARVINLYGPTEAAVYVTIADVTDARGRVTIGRPLYNCRAYVLDEALRRALPTAMGELYLAGACLSSGYVNREDLTNQVFLDDPFFPGEKMYKTGDLARLLPSGEIEYLGRRDSQVKLNGQRIELDEITGQMLRSAGVAEAATVAVRRQDGSMALRGFLCAKRGGCDRVGGAKTPFGRSIAPLHDSGRTIRAGGIAPHGNREDGCARPSGLPEHTRRARGATT